MKILITGASGFLGAETVARAARLGHDVRAMIRQNSPRERLALPASQLYVGDMTQPETFPGAVAGMEGVIHCAAVTATGATDEELSRRVNIDGTVRLFQAAKAAGVRRWIQISSMSAHPATTSAYGMTKLAADEFLRAVAPPPAWTILRPSLIYGPGGGKGLVDKTVKLLEKLPLMPILGAGREPIRPVYVGDVAEAAIECLEREVAIGKTYMLGGADEVSLNEFMAELARARGLKRPLIHIPLPLAMVLARAFSILLKNPPITVDNVKGVREAQRVEQEPAERDLGYRPLGLREGLRRTFAG